MSTDYEILLQHLSKIDDPLTTLTLAPTGTRVGGSGEGSISPKWENICLLPFLAIRVRTEPWIMKKKYMFSFIFLLKIFSQGNFFCNFCTAHGAWHWNRNWINFDVKNNNYIQFTYFKLSINDFFFHYYHFIIVPWYLGITLTTVKLSCWLVCLDTNVCWVKKFSFRNSKKKNFPVE